MIQTNRLTERLVISEIVSSATTIGQVVDTLEPVAVVYGTLLQQRGSIDTTRLPVAVYADEISFYCRFLDISNKKKYKLEYQERVYNIKEINHVGNRNREATIIRCLNSR